MDSELTPAISPEKQPQSFRNPDAHLLSFLGVTAANPEDIERDLIIAAAARAGRGNTESVTDFEKDVDIRRDVEDDQDASLREERRILNRLHALDQEINAVAAGLESLPQETLGQEEADDTREDEEEAKAQRTSEDTRAAEGFQLQRALGEERLTSLRKKRRLLTDQLSTWEARRQDLTVNGDLPDDHAQAKDGEAASSVPSKRAGPLNGKLGSQRQKNIVSFDDEEFDAALDAASRLVETERDRLIRTGVLTPFDRLKGFERRVERASSGSSTTQQQAESSIANVVASIAAQAKARPTSKLLDASELPKLAAPTREFHRLRRMHKSGGLRDKSEKTSKDRATRQKKRGRPMPEAKWRKRHRLNGEIGSHEERSEEAVSGDEDDESDRENTMEDTLLEGGLRIPSNIYNKLFDYQKTGVKWLWELHCQRAGGIIGDEMGLGKTIQVIAFLAALHHSGLYKPSIVVCPVTLLRQWKQEIRKWYGVFEVEILHDSAVSHSKNASKTRGNKGTEAEVQDDGEEDEYVSEEDKKQSSMKRLKKWNALIEQILKNESGLLLTSYEQLRILREKLLDTEWGYAVLDEGHRIRNPDADTTLTCKQLRTVHRIIMTGAPIQNRLTELWSLFDFVFPGKLGVLPVFQAQFALPITIGGYANATTLQVSTAYKCAVVLRDLIMPYLLRRLKSDVNAQLPKKTEHVLFCSLSEEQRSAYRAFLASSEVEQIFDGSRNSLYGIDILRKICNHPDLLERGHSANHPDYGNPERSGKLKVVVQVLDLWKSQGHRVLIFSQTQQMLDILENYVISKEYTYRRMDGSTPVRQRMALVDEFNEGSHVFVFLLTTRVGGLGTNLTGANRVIIFDPDWNPSTDMQARERAWRIGQSRDVTIYRLITRGTIEEKVYHRQIYKHFLTNKILRDPQQRRFFKARDMRDLFTLNDENQETKTETSTLFAEVAGDVDLGNQNKHIQPPGSRLKDLTPQTTKVKTMEEDQNMPVSARKGKGDVVDEEPHEEESQILKCLFEANGIHSAIDHNVIESMNELDKRKVDNESARVAQQAAEAVRQSRMLRSSDSVALPTWTGRSGAAGAPMAIRRRFGSATNSRFVSSSTSLGNDGNQGPESTRGASSSADVTAGLAGGSAGRALSSRDVLARIRKGQLSMGAEAIGPLASGIPNGLLTGAGSGIGRSTQTTITPENLSRQLQTFIEEHGGSVSSTLVVERFRDVVSASDAPLFRQLLKQIAILRRGEGAEARWVLKAVNQG